MMPDLYKFDARKKEIMKSRHQTLDVLANTWIIEIRKNEIWMKLQMDGIVAAHKMNLYNLFHQTSFTFLFVKSFFSMSGHILWDWSTKNWTFLLQFKHQRFLYISQEGNRSRSFFLLNKKSHHARREKSRTHQIFFLFLFFHVGMKSIARYAKARAMIPEFPQNQLQRQLTWYRSEKRCWLYD